VRLITAHKILISSAVALGVLLVPYGVREYRATGAPSALALAIGGGVAAVVLAIYLRAVFKRDARR
jgi:hypothetical protein